MNDATRGALIAGAAAILGTIGGGVATYLGSHQLQSEQFSKEERRDERRARGVARMYALDSMSAAAFLRATRGGERWSPYPDLNLPADEDRQLVLARLALPDAASVAAADGALRSMRTVIGKNLGNPISRSDRQMLSINIDALEDGAGALDALGDGP